MLFAKFLGTAEARYPSTIQLIRYGVVGIANNSLGYVFYLLLTWEWLDPKLAVSLLYPIGALIAYYSHAKYSFEYTGQHSRTLIPFAITHGFGYLTNITLLYVLVDLYLLPHQLVQILAIFVVAGLLFVLLKFFVFSARLGRLDNG